MSSPGAPCTTQTPAPPRKRVSSYVSVSNFSSAKRRRLSIFGADLDSQPEYEGGQALGLVNSIDRFVPPRPKNHIPLNVTPRTTRISRQFGLIDNRVFNFAENQENATINRDESNMLGLLRKNVLSLFRSPTRRRHSSVTENLSKRQQCVLTLDGPGINSDPYAYPITWSKRNFIAVACGNDVFYQNLDTRSVTHLCKAETPSASQLRAIEWAGKGRESILASGSSTGIVQMWDAGRGGEGTLLRMWRESEPTAVGGMDWNEDLISVGLYNGTISVLDTRSNTAARRVRPHKGKVMGVKWSPDGLYMASADDLGLVCIWDKRADKPLFDEATQSSRMRHSGPVKALAWCPWKPDLLATGSTFPEGKIRIWSLSTPSLSPTPLETIPLNTSVLSLHWSPHCKELLSTHASSFEPLPKSTRSAFSAQHRPRLRPVTSPLTNAIAVHEYPSGKRLLTLTAHFAPVTHSCLGPDGQNLFTVCPKEETIKMWNVWKKRNDGSKKESAFDRCTIR